MRGNVSWKGSVLVSSVCPPLGGAGSSMFAKAQPAESLASLTSWAQSGGRSLSFPLMGQSIKHTASGSL